MLRNTKLITISILPDLLGKLDRIAKEESRTRSELLREAVRRYIEEKEYQDQARHGRGRADQQAIGSEKDSDQMVEEERNKEASA